MALQGRTVERILGELASASHGVVTRAQALAAGLTADEIQHRLACGGLVRVHRGVYRVGHRAPSLEATYLAAVRACGDGDALSGQAAAHLYGLVKGLPPQPEVTTRTERQVRGIKTRRSRTLEPRDTTTWRGIPIMTVPYVLVDLAGRLSEEDLARACHEAGVRYRITPAHVEAVLARRPKATGASTLRRVLRGDVNVTLSRLERAFLQRLRDAGLPLPRTNRREGSYRVDCRWVRYRLTVELDSYRYHGSRHAWERDHRRARDARARGDEFRRYTYGDVVEDPGQMLAELRELLRRA